MKQGSSSSKIADSVMVKIFVITFLGLALLVPASMIRRMIRERDARSKDVTQEISDKWSGSQQITGPIISVPFREHYFDEKGKKAFHLRYFHVLPDFLDIQGKLIPEIRYRGIYEAVLYQSELKLTGQFPNADPESLGISPEDVIWRDAIITLGISDMRGILEQISLQFGQMKLEMNQGIKTNNVIPQGLSATLPMSGRELGSSFNLEIKLKGSRQIQMIPVGRETIVKLASSWKDPNFNGAFLPKNHTITRNGFTANWHILDLNRHFPQQWVGTRYQIHDTAFGLTLFQPVDIYQKTMRIAKYAIMFILFTFVAFFISEVMNRVRLHPIQYLLVGLSVVIFYLLLLSISEHINFDIAYLISSTAVICLISGYSISILRKTKLALFVSAFLAILYTFFYILLQLEDFALLLGSVGLFIVLGWFMYITRNIDWFSIKLENPAPTHPNAETLPPGD